MRRRFGVSTLTCVRSSTPTRHRRPKPPGGCWRRKGPRPGTFLNRRRRLYWTGPIERTTMTDDRVKSAFAGSETLLERDMIDEVRLAWRLYRDPRVNWLKNAVPMFALLYFLWPIDVLPDFL